MAAGDVRVAQADAGRARTADEEDVREIALERLPRVLASDDPDLDLV